jgi:diaminohydroxyphosphoribosylaminopyrimidine deaminase/5-amino-6-(5-phosphoribosylamino)uracil reductase
MNDEYYMKMALDLARKGRGRVSPNPMVGAVIVQNNRVIGKGYHRYYGGSHAEINAIRDAGNQVKGATLYVTLEPCCHEGKTPPCVNSIIEHKIKRVVIGAIDANPLVCREGVCCLQNRGIDVKTGVLEDDCRRLNEVFFHYMETGMPFITIKYAQTLDGRIATLTGNSQWISSPPSLKLAHQLRAEHDAILVGRGTVDQDDPELTVRLVRGRNPLRVIVDSELGVSPQAKVFQNLTSAPALIATVQKQPPVSFVQSLPLGVEIITTRKDKNGNVALKYLFKALARRNISSVLVEGGSQIITSVIRENLANRMVTVIAPKIIGSGIEAVGDLHIRNLKHAKKLSFQKVVTYGNDVIIDSRFI